MTHYYDFFGRLEKPPFILCNPSGREVAVMGAVRDTDVTVRYNAISELTFSVPFKLDGHKISYYKLLKCKRLVKVDGLGVFIITGVNENGNGIERSKEITAQSLEFELSLKKISQFTGTFKLYDFNNPSKTLIGEVMNYLPRWSIAHVDEEVASLYRTFDVSDQTIYNFLISDVEEAYECVFEFDTEARTISIKHPKNAVKKTDIFLSYNNLLKELDVEENSDELVTALSVFGGGDLNIRKVNPLGSNYIYDFSYFKTLEWMEQDLIDAITTWENKLEANQKPYADNLTALRTKNTELLTIQGELDILESECLALEGVQKARIEAGQAYDDVTAQINAKLTQISEKEVQETAKKGEISSVNTALTNISKSLQFTENFTSAQLEELSCFVVESTYQNENFIETSVMTEVEIQDMAQELFSQGKSVLSSLSQPRFTFTTDTVNFFFLKEFKPYTDQIRLGSEVTIDMEDEDGKFAYPILLEVNFSYDDPESLELTYGNRLRLDSEDYRFAELFGEAIKTSTSVNFDSAKWGEWVNSGAKDEFNDFVNSALDASVNGIINSENQEIVINQNGLRGRQYLPSTKTYSPQQVWLTSKNLVFSNDGFQTAQTALGEITMPDGSKSYGLVANAIIGKMIIGNKLAIADADGIVNISGNLITIKNDKNVEKVRLGKYDNAQNKYGLQLLNTNGNVVLDEDGILQTWQEGKCDNVASGYPLRLYVYVPSGTKSIRKASLRWKVDKFRAFSTATGGGGYQSTSTNSGGGTSDTTASKSSVSTSTESGGGSTKTTTSQNEQGGSGGHDHGLDPNVKLAVYGGQVSINGEYAVKRDSSQAYVTWVKSGAHTHSVDIPSHSHDFTIPSHYHSFSVPSHSHTFTISDHTHTINYGIYESTTPTSIKVTINGVQRGSTYSGDIADFDISAYLAVGQWNTIEISSTRLGRIDATCFIQALMSTD